MNSEEDRCHDPTVHADEPLGEITDPDVKPVLDILSRLVVACKSRLLYSADHPAVKDAVVVLHAILSDSLAHLPEIAVRVEKDGFVYREQKLGGERESLRQLASRTRMHNVRSISFSQGVGVNEVESLVELLVIPPEDLEKEGGAEAFLLGRGIHGIGVVESEAWRADEELATVSEEAAMDALPREIEEEAAQTLTEEELESLLDLIFDPEKLARALERLHPPEGGGPAGVTWTEAAFSFLKNAAVMVERRFPECKASLYRAMAEALLFLERDSRNALLSRKLLPELRNERLCAKVLSCFSPDEMAGVLSYFLPLATELIPKVDDLLEFMGYRGSDRLRTIALLRERLIDLGELPPALLSPLDEWLRSTGLEEATKAMPTLGEISLLSEAYQPQEMEEIMRIAEMDLALENYVNVTPMLLDLLSWGGKIDNLGRAIDFLQEHYWGLAAAAQFGLAAEVLDGMEKALQGGDPAFAPHCRELERFMEEATKQQTLTMLTHLASAKRGDPEITRGFVRFMEQLGDGGITAMIEALGSEESMSVRKFIIDVLAEVARERLPLLASYLDDPRWYLVRNIVTVMARIRSPLTLGYLEHAMQHPHPKVKAEAIRAIGLSGGSQAGNLLLNGLRDENERARILCIRWLGRLRETRATSRLESMLEEKEPGGESLPVKKEIIECLANIGDPGTYEILAKYAGKQWLFFKSEWQELNLVAQVAMQRLRERYPHLEKKKVSG